MTAKTSRGGAATIRCQVWAEGASIAPDCSRARSAVRHVLRRRAIDPVALAHGVEARGGVGVEQGSVTLDQGDDLVAQIAAASRPLEVRPPAVMVGAVERAPRIGPPQPLERLLVAHVHAQ